MMPSSCIPQKGSPSRAFRQYVTKGFPLFIQGELRIREYTGKDGTSRTSIDVLVGTFQLLGNKPVAANQEQSLAKEEMPM